MQKYCVEIDDDDNVRWYKFGTNKLHREGGLPAVEFTNGYKVYYVNGLRHREGDLPAVEWADGSKEFYVNGLIHREGGLPAAECVNGDKEYCVNGKLHREGGLPAIEYVDGTKEYWVNGKRITAEEAKMLASNPCANKIVEIDGVRYSLTPVE